MASQTRSAGLGENDAAVGINAWSNPTNIYSSNNAYASANNDAGEESQYLKATTFGFNIPLEATIDGIEINVERHASGAGQTKDYRVRVVKGGSIGATELADTATSWPGTDTVKTYGGSSNLLGETWTAAQINATNFGMVIATSETEDKSDDDTGFIDHIYITVYYTVPDGIVLDTTSSNTTLSGTTCTASATPTVSNSIVFAWVFAYRTGGVNSPSGVTWNGNAMTEVTGSRAEQSNGRGSWWYYVNGTPDAASHDVVATYTNTQDVILLGVHIYGNASQTGQPEAYGSGHNFRQEATASVTSLSDGARMVGGCAMYGTSQALTASSPMTQRLQFTTTGYSGTTGDYPKATAGAQTLTFDVADFVSWVVSGVAVKPIVAASANSGMFLVF